ncbi:acidPPc domain-containing protein [Psidium guajava]|nr:acidPPc domain-containing protein [Psidium guajava]
MRMSLPGAYIVFLLPASDESPIRAAATPAPKAKIAKPAITPAAVEAPLWSLLLLSLPPMSIQYDLLATELALGSPSCLLANEVNFIPRRPMSEVVKSRLKMIGSSGSRGGALRFSSGNYKYG